MLAVSVKSHTTEVRDLSVVEVPKPVPTSRQVLVKVHCAGANPVDCYVIGGLMMKAGWKLKFPFIPGYEFSGRVESVGEHVRDFRVGDEVFGINWGSANHDSLDGDSVASCFAEYVAVSANKICLKPSNVSFEVAAGLSMVGSVAYQAVHQCGKVGRGSRVLVLGGSTAVGAISIQLCKQSGAFVATTCSSQSASYVSQFHPDLIVRYDREKWYAHPQCERFDFVLDLAGAASTLELLKTSEHLIAVGAAFVSLVNPSVGLVAQGHPPFSYCRFYCLHQNNAHQRIMADEVANGNVRLPIAGVHPLTTEGVRAMFQAVKSGKSRGKHILKFV